MTAASYDATAAVLHLTWSEPMDTADVVNTSYVTLVNLDAQENFNTGGVTWIDSTHSDLSYGSIATTGNSIAWMTTPAANWKNAAHVVIQSTQGGYLTAT